MESSGIGAMSNVCVEGAKVELHKPGDKLTALA